MNAVALTLALALAQLSGGSPTPAPPADAAKLRTMAQEILGRLETMRGQKLSKPLKTGVKGKPEVTKFIQERLREEYGPEKVAAEGRMLKLFGLLPPDLDYGAFITSLLTEQVAGFYDHVRKELHIADWLAPMLQEPVMAHEIFHAIQDQEWGGGALIDSKKYSHDAVLAHAALMEGDATVVMFNYQQSLAGNETDITESPFFVNMIATSIPMQMATPQFPVMSVAPDYLKQSLVFPYQQGLLFIAALRQAGMSWADVRKVYADPPQSTEQVLHPERYHPKRDVPSEVTFPVLVPGFKRAWDGTAGEFHYRQLLLSQLSAADAAAGADGWDGDFTALETDGARAFVAAALTWDAEAEAEAFVKAAEQVHAKRKGPKPTQRLTRTGSEVFLVLSDDAALAKQAHEALVRGAKVTRR